MKTENEKANELIWNLAFRKVPELGVELSDAIGKLYHSGKSPEEQLALVKLFASRVNDEVAKLEAALNK